MGAENKARRRWRRLLWLALVVAVFFGGSRYLNRPKPVEQGTVVRLDLGGSYQERAPDDLMSLVAGTSSQSLFDLLLMIRDAGEDPRLAGLVVRLGSLDIGWAKAQEFREALLRFRESGKPLVAYLENEFSGSTLEYYVASAAEEIYVPPAGSALVNGLLAQYVFLGGLWEKLDVDMQVVKIREYKTAGDMLVNKAMSAAHREMANSLLDSIYGQVVRGVAVQREMSEEAVRAAFDRGPASADDLISAGLVDGAKFLDEVEDDLAGEEGEILAGDEYAGRRLPRKVETAGRVALVYGIGPIFTGAGGEGVLDDEQGMGSDTISDAFADIAEDDDIDAIVFRVDSPGGSALASDLIWRATQRAKEEKPVVVSMSDVAGSGGYYVAAGASKIVALPGTFTGSIGVVLSKPNISGLLAKLGVNAQTLQRGDNAGLVSVTDSLSGAQLVRVKENMDSVYRLFVARVAEGRGLEAAAVNDVGRGRVWTGEQALEKGLVDQLGGLLSAIDVAKEAAGIDTRRRVEIVVYPREKDVFERLSKAFGTRAATYMPALWKRVRATLAAYEFPSGSILTLMPAEIAIR